MYTAGDMGLLDQLNEEQKQAVTHREGPLMIVAGAGTGKTTVITRRIAWLIDQGLAKPEQILALTFTEKAASEMEERVDLLLPYGYVDLQISTFHAFCERILHEYGAEIGLSPNFEVITELDAWLLVRQELDRFALDYFRPMGNPTKYLRALLQHFSRVKDQAVTPEQYLAFAQQAQAASDHLQTSTDAEGEQTRLVELAHAYHTYQQLLLENDRLDFGDLILYTLRLLRERPAVRSRLAKRYPFILVDEFQDTNHAQYELVKLLCDSSRNITVVGDDDQAIYKFRGASIENILRFQSDYPDATRVVLMQNYRSTQAILDRAHEFIQMNNPRRLEAQHGLSKQLLSNKPGDALIEHLHLHTSDEEVRAVMEKISELKKKDPETLWSDFAVLVRSNDAGADFAHTFERHKIPFQFLALSGLYNKPIILDTLSLLRVIDQPHDSPNLYRVLLFPFWKLSALCIAELNRFAARKGKSLYEAMQMAKSFSAIDPDDLQSIDRVLHVLATLSQIAKTKTASETLISSVRHSGYLEYVNTQSEQKKRESFGYLQQLLERVKSFEKRAGHGSLHAFLEEFTHERNAGEEGALAADLEAGPDVVRILTVHAAKGLEFRYVFVVNLVDRKFPTSRRADAIPLPDGLVAQTETSDESLFHLEEERRLFYVAMTRAKEGLFFTSADDYGGARKRKLSRFLDELGYTKPVLAAEQEFQLLDEDQDAPETMEDLNLHKYIPKHFSFTQLAAFQTCPLQYKFAHILRVPVLGKWTFSFGKTMHNTLHRYFTAWMERTGKKQGGLFEETKGGQERTEGDTVPVSVDELLEMYKHCWQDDWYPNDRVREQYRTKGREQLIRYVSTFAEQTPTPLALEQGYTYKIGDVILKGRIDRIDTYEDGIEIIDYKTGTPKTEKSLERSDKEQLWLYQLAARDVLKLTPKKLTYVYLEDQSRVSFIGSDEELTKLQEDVMERVGRIRASGFHPTPGFHCRFCDFADICEYRQT